MTPLDVRRIVHLFAIINSSEPKEEREFVLFNFINEFVDDKELVHEDMREYYQYLDEYSKSIQQTQTRTRLNDVKIMLICTELIKNLTQQEIDKLKEYIKLFISINHSENNTDEKFFKEFIINLLISE